MYVRAGYIMYGGTVTVRVQSTVSTTLAFLALANFPLLNVNFAVIDVPLGLSALFLYARVSVRLG